MTDTAPIGDQDGVTDSAASDHGYVNVSVLILAALLIVIGVPIAIAGGWWPLGMSMALVGMAFALIEVTQHD